MNQSIEEKLRFYFKNGKEEKQGTVLSYSIFKYKEDSFPIGGFLHLSVFYLHICINNYYSISIEGERAVRPSHRSFYNLADRITKEQAQRD